MNNSIRDRFKIETGKEIDINTRVFAHSVTHINKDYVLWLEEQLKTDNSLLVNKIEDLISEWKKAELPDEKVPFSAEAEIGAGFKFFVKWLRHKFNIKIL